MSDATERLITLRDKLVIVHDEAMDEAAADDAEWERRGYAGEAQDTEEAEASGALRARADTLAEVIELVVEEIVIADRGGVIGGQGTTKGYVR